MISLIAVFLVFAFTFNYSEKLFGLLTLPLKSELTLNFTKPYFHTKEKAPISLVFLAPAEAFWMHMKVSFIASIVLSLPIIFHQLWRFISPGLKSREKKYVLPFVFSATGLFTAGAAFCFLIILPFAMTFLLGIRQRTWSP
jgi:sec-independent protein translocase protein TatC